jgi:hypothetical protein
MIMALIVGPCGLARSAVSARACTSGSVITSRSFRPREPGSRRPANGLERARPSLTASVNIARTASSAERCSSAQARASGDVVQATSGEVAPERLQLRGVGPIRGLARPPVVPEPAVHELGHGHVRKPAALEGLALRRPGLPPGGEGPDPDLSTAVVDADPVLVSRMSVPRR